MENISNNVKESLEDLSDRTKSTKGLVSLAVLGVVFYFVFKLLKINPRAKKFRIG